MIDDAYAAQMALRQELIRTKQDQVIKIDPAALLCRYWGRWWIISPAQRRCSMDGVVQTLMGGVCLWS